MRSLEKLLDNLGAQSAWRSIPRRRRLAYLPINALAASVPVLLISSRYRTPWVWVPLAGLWVILMVFIVTLAINPERAPKRFMQAAVIYLVSMLLLFLILLAMPVHR